ISGTVEWVRNDEIRTALTRQFLAERQLSEPWPGFDQQELVEFTLDRGLLTLTSAREGLSDGHTVWREERAPVRRPCRPSSAANAVARAARASRPHRGAGRAGNPARDRSRARAAR